MGDGGGGGGWEVGSVWGGGRGKVELFGGGGGGKLTPCRQSKLKVNTYTVDFH